MHPVGYRVAAQARTQGTMTLDDEPGLAPVILASIGGGEREGLVGGPLFVKLWGELACFTRPELKVERVSYLVMTPSAARGALEAIFWRPAFSWRIREIRVLRPPRFASMVRNEVTRKATKGAPSRPFYADDHRTQRHTLALRDVAYVIAADIVLRPQAGAGSLAGFRDQFRRRVQRGQCFQTPYLGCREFPAFFGPLEPGDTPVDSTEDLGPMLFDLDYFPDPDRPRPIFFQARLEHGVMRPPQELYARLSAPHAA